MRFKFNKTNIEGAYIIDLMPLEDERGSLTRIWDAGEFKEAGVDMMLSQGYVTKTKLKGTMRGIHYQVDPAAEAKLGRCVKGAIWEAIVDLRKDSQTFKKWDGFEFRNADNKLLFVPAGVGHAILTLEDNTEFLNFSNKPFTAECERGIRYNDPEFNIAWPIHVEHVSRKDLSWPGFVNIV